MSEKHSDESFTTDQFDDEPVSRMIMRDGEAIFVLVYADGTEVEEKPKSKKEKLLEAMDKIDPRKKED